MDAFLLTLECAGVVIDLTMVLIDEADERLEKASKEFEQHKFSRAIYHTYTAYINLAKSLLIKTDEKLNTQNKIIDAFDRHHGDLINDKGYSFSKLVLSMKEYEPDIEFATWYMEQAHVLKNTVIQYQKSTNNE